MKDDVSLGVDYSLKKIPNTYEVLHIAELFWFIKHIRREVFYIAHLLSWSLLGPYMLVVKMQEHLLEVLDGRIQDSFTLHTWRGCGQAPGKCHCFTIKGSASTMTWISIPDIVENWHTKYSMNDGRYYYKVGHKVKGGTYVWGTPYSFRSAPAPGENTLQRVIIFGGWLCTLKFVQSVLVNLVISLC